MKTLYLTAGTNSIWVDTENETTGRLDREPTYNIDSIYVIDEPMKVVYQYEDENVTLNVKKGDVLVKWDRNRNIKNRLTVIKGKDFVDNFKSLHAAEQKAKEEWAKRQAEAEVGCDLCDAKCANC